MEIGIKDDAPPLKTYKKNNFSQINTIYLRLCVIGHSIVLTFNLFLFQGFAERLIFNPIISLFIIVMTIFVFCFTPYLIYKDIHEVKQKTDWNPFTKFYILISAVPGIIAMFSVLYYLTVRNNKIEEKYVDLYSTWGE